MASISSICREPLCSVVVVSASLGTIHLRGVFVILKGILEGFIWKAVSSSLAEIRR